MNAETLRARLARLPACPAPLDSDDASHTITTALTPAAVLIPVVLAYTGTVYWLFRGKIQPGEGYH